MVVLVVNMVLSRVVNGLGVFVRADPGPIQRKEKIQRVRVILEFETGFRPNAFLTTRRS